MQTIAPEPQMALPFPLDAEKLSEFLTSWCAIEDEEDRLREQKRLLKEEYTDSLPLRGVLAAVKIVRTAHKLEAHPKEPLRRAHLAYLEACVERHLTTMRQEVEATVAEGLRPQDGQRPEAS